MRKVTTQTVSAFLAGKKLTQGNTSTDGQALFLHGNKIAEKREDGIYATLAGWNTPTTRERLNALPGARFNQKDFAPYFNGKLISATEWVKLA